MDKDNALATIGTNLGLAVDAKLTPAQLIDLIIEEMTDEVETELKESEDRLRELEEREFSYAEISHIVGKSKFRVEVDTYVHGSRTNHYVCMAGRNSDDSVVVSPRDKVLGPHIREVMELSERVNELRVQKQNIDGNKRKFRATIMKRVLEGTAEGRNVLSQIKTLKLQLRTQLSKKSK